MVVSKRERYIGISAVAAIGLLLLDQFLLSPYTVRRESVAKDLEIARSAQSKADDAFRMQNRLKKTWADFQQRGLKSEYSLAEGQALQAILDWAQTANVTLAGVKPERTVTQESFQIISFHVTATGTMNNLSRLLLALETATIPLRVNDLQIAPKKENTDELTLQMSVSTLSTVPEDSKPRSAVSDAGSAAR